MEMKIDRLSQLPDHIVEEILSRLQTKDAVRTSLLSRKWRHKWTTTSSIVFDETFPFGAYIFNNAKELVSIVDHVLSCHVGPIQKFKLSYDFAIPENNFELVTSHCYEVLRHRDIDRWILGLSSRHIEELSLVRFAFPHYTLPSRVFSFQNLTKLELFSCSLKPLETFKGFANLKRLHLDNVTLARDVFKILICSSPMLEWVSLSVNLTGGFVENINVDAPKLRFFKFFGNLADITFRNTFRLAEVFILSHSQQPKGAFGMISLMSKFFDHLLQVRRLTLAGDFFKYLALGDFGGLPREFPLLQNLQHLCIAVNFNSRKESVAAYCLLRSAPNLQELHIVEAAISIVENVNADFLEVDHMNFRLNELRRVRMVSVFGNKSEIEFINYILSTSPVLETMEIHPFDSLCKPILEESLWFEHGLDRTKLIIEESNWIGKLY